jgi:amidohydrolase
MIEEGLLEGVDRAFAVHVNTTAPVGVVECRGGAFLASGDELNITLRGRGGHASAPHTARDPIAAAAAMVGAIQTMITREVDVFDPAMVTIAHIDSCTTNNIIPEVARIEGTIRCNARRNGDASTQLTVVARLRSSSVRRAEHLQTAR